MTEELKQQKKQSENNIFDLINHLNEENNNSQENSALMSSTPTESHSDIDNNERDIDLIMNSIEPIRMCDNNNNNNNGELELSQSSENSSLPSCEQHNASIDAPRRPRTRIPIFGIPNARPASSVHISSASSLSSTATKIPRMSVCKPKNNIPIPIPTSTPRTNSARPTMKKNSLTESTNLNNNNNNNKLSRSYSKPIQQHQRGSSLSAAVSINSLGSIGYGCGSAENKKPVRYAVKHKPRESKVKIFSQKVEIRNVSSKIGSLDNANHKPAGGDVIIETKPLSWNAQSKINSLEKAKNYVPNGGNIKIESHKLNWNAAAKIGSLEKAASYQPHGGNVKIENRKLNFKAKARPRTDTGLVIIETNDYLDQSQYSNDNFNETNDFSS